VQGGLSQCVAVYNACTPTCPATFDFYVIVIIVISYERCVVIIEAIGAVAAVAIAPSSWNINARALGLSTAARVIEAATPRLCSIRGQQLASNRKPGKPCLQG
jgi:hypothetical protein